MIRPRAPWRALLALLALLLATVLAATSLGVPARAADPESAPVADDAEEVAELALETVQDIVEAPAPESIDPTTGQAVAAKELTLALRDLAVARDDLPSDKRDDAARLLARPTDSAAECATEDLACYGSQADKVRCNTAVCVHWVSSGRHAATSAFVDIVLTTMRRVANTYVSAGYRKPVSDGGVDGTTLPDIYLGNLGEQGVYGYCTTDEDVAGHVPAPAYCVLDNNYAEFGIAPRAALQVTAAHEYFHAIQFAYDVNEDGWIMEATASWVEDELYDSINDNRAYLPYGPLGRPGQSLDAFTQLEPYGTWIFFRYLSESYPTSAGGLPTIVRSIWDRLASGGSGNDNVYSLQALTAELAGRGTSLSTRLALFAIWNRQPSRYEEGAAYRPAPLRRTFTMSPSLNDQSVVFGLDRLATGTYRFTRTSNLVRDNLTLRFDLNSRAIGNAAIVAVKRKGQPVSTRLVSLDADGLGTTVTTFGSLTEWVEITVVNGDTRSNCWTGGDFTSTCQGTPVATSLRQSFRATVTG